VARNRYDIDEKLDAPFNLEQFKSLLRYTRPYAGQLSKTFAAMFIASALNLLAPLILMLAINQYIPQKDVRGLVLISAGYTAIVVFVSFMTAYRMRSMNKVGQGIIHGWTCSGTCRSCRSLILTIGRTARSWSGLSTMSIQSVTCSPMDWSTRWSICSVW